MTAERTVWQQEGDVQSGNARALRADEIAAAVLIQVANAHCLLVFVYTFIAYSIKLIDRCNLGLWGIFATTTTHVFQLLLALFSSRINDTLLQTQHPTLT